MASFLKYFNIYKNAFMKYFRSSTFKKNNL
jgi:hypothetical protein